MKRTFPQLMEEEDQFLSGTAPKPDSIQCSSPGRAGEPYVTFRSEARSGLALSGGGIRSATFALGVLQAMARRGVLQHLDYLSTVSGGGYAGAFWKRWRAKNPQLIFPEQPDSATPPADGREDPALRHLREFSRFLAPRLGAFSMDVWWPAAVILCGLALTLVIGCAFILLVMSGWAFLAQAMTIEDGHRACVGFWSGVLTAGLVLLLELRNYFYHRVWKDSDAFATTVVTAGALFLSFWIFWPFLPCQLHGVFPDGNNSLTGVMHGLFGPVYAWLLAALIVGGLARLFHARWTSTGGTVAGAMERAAGRLFAIAFFWALPAGLWAAALHFSTQKGSAAGAAETAGSFGAGLTALFALLHKWADKAETKRVSATIFQRAGAWGLKLVAWLAVLLLFLTAALALIAWTDGLHPAKAGRGDWTWPLLVSLSVTALACGLYKPNRMGLHSFYRSRIARCYLGAAGAAIRTDDVRYSAELPDDDMKMAEDEQKPLHLVCCAANHQAGDRLPTLHRGSRSAVLSRHGLSMGEYTVRDDAVRLSSAVTASAAAFNSQMGNISMRLGPAVSFLASLTNLRLGLWKPSPAYGDAEPKLYRAFPGLLYFLEALNMSRTNGRMLHLSDGGHFENLAAYELIRRRCRTIIICDGSADPDRKFDNLGNFVRRVREDFGVEIDIDASPQKLDEKGLSSAYAVAGTIRYQPGAGGGDGLLIYIKPSMIGSEPEDIRHYRESRPDFPHEGTSDQFFDEAQWESYRRLGQCAGESVFEAVRHLAGNQTALSIFDAVRRNLATPAWNEPGAYERLGDLTRELEKDMADAAGGQLLREAWPERAFWSPSVAGSPATPPDDSEILTALVRMLTSLEEIFCGINVTSSNGEKVDDPWINWIARWLAIPSLRKWWTPLRPLFGTDFARFAAEKGLPSVAQVPQLVRVCPFWMQNWRTEFAGSIWAGSVIAPHGAPGEVLRLALLDPHLPGRSVEVGLLLFRRIIDANGVTTIAWDARDLWLPPGWAGTWTRTLLEKAIQHLTGVAGRFMVNNLSLGHAAATEGDYRQFGFNPDPACPPDTLVRS
jgi:hypothetical protein